MPTVPADVSVTAAPSAAGSPPALAVRTVVLSAPGPLLALLPEQGALAWVQDGEGLVGWGEAARCELTGADRFEQARTWWSSLVGRAEVRDDVRRPGTGLVGFGSFAFDPLAASSVVVVPEVVVGHRDGIWWITTIGSGSPALPSRSAPRSPVTLTFEEDRDRDEAWMATVAQAVTRISAGDLDKVVLARDLVARADEPVDLRWPLQRLARDYAGCWVFAVDGLLGATPELLVRLDRGVATSRVLAGTLSRSGDLNEDRRRGDNLPRSIKDVEEHGYGVRSVVEALGRHGDVDLPAEPFVLELRNVMHLATDVRAVVGDGSTSLDLLASLHPSAAVCGSPTADALALIRAVEGLQRGRYAGPVGWLDASGDGEWGIALRCAEVDAADPRRLRLFAGCGIVAGSAPSRELAESNAKLVPMRQALSGS
ncbi:MAG: isochorismate synthase [Mycobacteriales bacterium]